MPTDVRVSRHGVNRLHPSSGRRSRASAGDRRRSQPPAQARAAGENHSAVSAERLPVLEVARRAGVSRPAVWRWQARYAEQGVDGLLRDKTRKPGRAPLSAKVVAKIVELTCSEPPGEATHWTGRAMAKAVGVSLRAVQRLWEAHRLQPHRIRTFKRSSDPDFAEKVEDVVGLYMDPPSARRGRLDRREEPNSSPRPHPARPAAQARQMRDHDPRLQTQRHDDAVRRAQRARRNRDRALHEAPSPPGVHPLPQRRRARRAGRQGRPRHRRQLRHPQASQRPADGSADHPRWTFHFTPTSASWLNAVEGFFSAITRRRIRRGAFASVADLQDAIARYIAAHNKASKPFVWTTSAKAIFDKLAKVPVPSV